MALRITNQMMSKQTLHNLTSSMRRLDRYTQQLSTGKRILAPSDDPPGTEVSMRLRTAVAEHQQYAENVADGITWLNTTDAALGQVTEVLQRARQLTVYGANDAVPQQGRLGLVYEVDQLIEDIIAVGNLTHSNRFIFSGSNTLTEPFAVHQVKSDGLSSDVDPLDSLFPGFAGGDFVVNGATVTIDPGDTLQDVAAAIGAAPGVSASVAADPSGSYFLVIRSESGKVDSTFLEDGAGEPLKALGVLDGSGLHKHAEVRYAGTSGSATSLEYEIGPGMTIRINVHGDDAIQPAINALLRVRESLEAGDVRSLSGPDLAQLDEAIDAVLRWRAEIGARSNRLELVQTRLQETELNLKRLLSSVEDVDVAEALMELKMEENVYRVALASGARIIQPSLMDFLR